MYNLPKLIFLTGTDGVGKSTVSQWLVEILKQRGIKTCIVWSRFRNYLSKPFLGMTRLTGHNYFKEIDGVLFGYHDFDRLKHVRYVYAAMQSVDVNIAAFLDITRRKRKYDVIICERGPWDTVVDVSADTGLNISAMSILGRIYSAQVRSDSKVILIERSMENILKTRQELVHDKKLKRKINIYSRLADECKWLKVDNNMKLKETMSNIGELLGMNVD